MPGLAVEGAGGRSAGRGRGGGCLYAEQLRRAFQRSPARRIPQRDAGPVAGPCPFRVRCLAARLHPRQAAFETRPKDLCEDRWPTCLSASPRTRWHSPSTTHREGAGTRPLNGNNQGRTSPLDRSSDVADAHLGGHTDIQNRRLRPLGRFRGIFRSASLKRCPWRWNAQIFSDDRSLNG